MGGMSYPSWGRYPLVEQTAAKIRWRHQPLPLEAFPEQSCLPRGNGRSYGDVCLNAGGVLLDARPLDHFIAFDRSTGVLRCEAGVLLSEILEFAVPRGWFPPVTPGTQFVTLGGAIANDVHGKNHHRGGNIGNHILRLELLRSDGRRILCSPEENAEWFRATIAGLGLTGLITWAEIRLKPVQNPFIRQETIRLRNIDAFFEVATESDRDWEYTVAWVDCIARGKDLGRGIYFRGEHAKEMPAHFPRPGGLPLAVPFVPPVSLVNRWSLRAFNQAYYRRQRAERKSELVHYRPFFYPLDSVAEWNRIYGPRGFLQYQCVLPGEQGRDGIREILDRIAASGLGSFLAVLKLFGDVPGRGLLSFPRPGVTLALDFPNRGDQTLKLLAQLDEVTLAAGGAVYPAKDASMSADAFQRYYPQWAELAPFIDPRFSSSFWRRVTGGAA